MSTAATTTESVPTRTEPAELTYLEAISEGLREEMRRDETVFCLGEDIGAFGGAFKVTDGFIEEFGAARVIDTPLAENARRRFTHGSIVLPGNERPGLSPQRFPGVVGGRSGRSARGNIYQSAYAEPSIAVPGAPLLTL